jgi:putative tricarboxylic transport membrane protein
MMLGPALGIVVGAIPGLTGAMLIALTLPLTFAMDGPAAMVLLVSMYVGSISGGLITATLLRMPGTPASIMTTLDGYPLAQKGQPGRALGLGMMASFAGGMISWVFLVLLAKPMANFAIKLGPFEFFSLVLMALVLIAAVSGDSLLKGLLSGFFGIVATLPGVNPATGELRMTFGMQELDDGLKLLPVLIGLFALSQILRDIIEIDRVAAAVRVSTTGIWMRGRDWSKHFGNMLRSSVIGTWVGILPGIGANIGSVLAYATARNLSKHPEEFGEGAEAGIVASEAANNATIGGALIPLVALGIPGSVIDAILLGALVLHGLQPGPLLFRDHPEIVCTIIITMLVANAFMLLFMMASVRWLARLVEVPRAYLLPVILVFCVVGSYALANRMFDVWVMLAFGLVGFALENAKIPLAPFVIGFVLAPEAEKNLGKGLITSGGSFWPIVTRPISAVFFFLAIAMFCWPLWRRWKQKGERPA